MTLSPAAGTAAQVLADWAAAVRWEDVPEDVREETRTLATNSVAAAVGGRDLADTARAVGVVRDEAEPGGSSVFLAGLRAPFASAVFANVVLFSALGQEETHVETAIHPAEVILPVLLGWAERHPVSGRELLTALLIGAETAIQANSLDMLPEVRAEVAETAAIYGAIGTAAAMARLLGLDAARAAQALRVAAACAGGTSECFAAGTSEFHFALGTGAEVGYRAARLAARGAVAAPRAFEGASGLYRLAGAVAPDVLAARDVPGELRERLAASWRVLELAYKPYPVHIYNVPFVDAAARLVAGGPLAPDDVAEVVVELNGPAAAYGGDYLGPFDVRDQVVGATGFLVAAMLATGRCGLAETQALDDPRVRALLARTRVTTSPDPARGSVTVREARGDGAPRSAEVVFDAARLRMDRASVAALHRPTLDAVIGPERGAGLLAALDGLEAAAAAGPSLVPLLEAA